MALGVILICCGIAARTVLGAMAGWVPGVAMVMWAMYARREA